MNEELIESVRFRREAKTRTEKSFFDQLKLIKEFLLYDANPDISIFT